MGSAALKKTAHAAEQERPDRRRAPAGLARKPTRSRSPPRSVFIDGQTGASTKMARLRRLRSKRRGQRLPCRGPMDIGRTYLHRRSTPGWPDRADAPGRADEWGRLPCLRTRPRPRFPPWYRLIRSSWTTCLLTRSPASNRQSRRRARHVCSVPPYSPDFNPASNKPSPNSRPCSERPRLEPSMTYGMPSPSHHRTLHTNRMRQLLR